MERDTFVNLYLETLYYKEDYLAGFIKKNQFAEVLKLLSDKIISLYDNDNIERADCNGLLKLINSSKALIK